MFQYVIQILAAWIIPEIPDRNRDVVDLPEDDFKGRVVDVLPSLDKVERSGISSLATSTSEGGSLQQIVDQALGTVLYRPAKNDPKAFLASLTKSFVPRKSMDARIMCGRLAPITPYKPS